MQGAEVVSLLSFGPVIVSDPFLKNFTTQKAFCFFCLHFGVGGTLKFGSENFFDLKGLEGGRLRAPE